MYYQFMELNDKTVIVHSPMDSEGKVKVYMERPTDKNPEDCFDHAVCWLPEYKWEEIVGYNEDEINYLKEFIESVAHVIIELSQTGGFNNAANF